MDLQLYLIIASVLLTILTVVTAYDINRGAELDTVKVAAFFVLGSLVWPLFIPFLIVAQILDVD